MNTLNPEANIQTLDSSSPMTEEEIIKMQEEFKKNQKKLEAFVAI